MGRKPLRQPLLRRGEYPTVSPLFRAWDSRIETVIADISLYPSLHPTQYPWEHLKWNKTFDHQA